MANLYIGTSGWVYSHWEEIFYPEDLGSKDYNPPTTRLKYFSQHFKTTEVNYSFYHLPKPTTYQNWYSQTPGNFLFAVKASRFITHIKRLKGVEEACKIFIKNALNLKEKLGPILFQFPPSFRATEENIKRLNEFLKFVNKNNKGLRFAFEFRHKTWCEEKIYKILKKYKAAWVIADSPRYPKTEKITADFVYIRMHGSKVLFSSEARNQGSVKDRFLFSSKYTKKELKDLAEKIKKWSRHSGTPPRRGKDVFVYFNNDAYGYAVENAKTLIKLLE